MKSIRWSEGEILETVCPDCHTVSVKCKGFRCECGCFIIIITSQRGEERVPAGRVWDMRSEYPKLVQNNQSDPKFICWKTFMPYGMYVCADGREVLFNRLYEPILQRRPGEGVSEIDRKEYVESIRQGWLYGGGHWEDTPYGHKGVACRKRLVEAVRAFKAGEPVEPMLRGTDPNGPNLLTPIKNRVLRYTRREQWDFEFRASA
jgi:hypothetical protein